MSNRKGQALDEAAATHFQDEGFTPRLIACRAHILNELIAPGVVLDFGCADGHLTLALAGHHRRLVAVDGSATRVERTRRRTREAPAEVDVRQALFEEFRPPEGERYDAIVLSCVLEHVDDPVELLQRCREWLSPKGVIAAIVPNSRSLHRRAGVRMGILGGLDALAESDEVLDHRRVYSLETLAADFQRAGLEVRARGGYLLKPLPNSMMSELPGALVDAFEALGRDMPDLAAEIYALGAAE